MVVVFIKIYALRAPRTVLRYARRYTRVKCETKLHTAGSPPTFFTPRPPIAVPVGPVCLVCVECTLYRKAHTPHRHTHTRLVETREGASRVSHDVHVSQKL